MHCGMVVARESVGYALAEETVRIMIASRRDGVGVDELELLSFVAG